MPNTVTITVEELEALRAQRDLLLGERDTLKGELRVVMVERDLLLERLKAFQRQLFAAKSEARGSQQKDLFLNEAEALGASAAAQPAEEESDEIDVPAHKRSKRGRKPLDPALPRVPVRHELPESARVCPHDGQPLVEIGVQISEQLDIVPQQVRVIQHQRVKYACPCCDDSIKVTPAPARIIPKGLLTESALAWCITSKYQDSLPLYRQAALLHRFGGDLSRSTLAASVVRVGQAVQPIINLLRDHLLESDVVYGDETTVQVLKEAGRSAQRKSYLWAQMNGSGSPVRLFAYSPTREAKQARALYAGIKRDAALMTDGYAPYDEVANTYQLAHLGCWAHARRYLIEAEDALPRDKRADHPVAGFLQRIGKLFAVETHTREMEPEARQRVRAEQSKPLLAEIETMLLLHLHTVLPASAFGRALHYLHGQWPKLVRYVENGAWPISNNPCENAIRPFVVGRRNWLFCDTVAGANASANLYSLVETAKANGIDPYQYLVALFKALPLAQTADDYEALMPWRLKPSAV
ncbi:IS66 family transposase [Ralstonia pseudosolanacearum]|uniref:IS66 family transposase n=1 Tax=Ralstonia pseudosolanacearum TaxID=1310165 RepID=UPI0025B61D4A|nr:IS66 family transposase [Ralstonia pseudosolanacearum]MDN3370313.1 IS66 family transposase [Ralstonia pseudosolanacearum]